jgi:AraC family transcriptional regulator of adaptative response / methylphosphotriester-DNA alkyltransferase methyltransferase
LSVDSLARMRPATFELRAAIFSEAVSIVAAEYARPITAEDVSRRVASSPRQLRRAFAEIGGTGFRAFLQDIRMTEAARLLRGTEIPVRDVGQRVGYSEPGQFAKAFKRAYGVTPSMYRATRRAA